ncbi:MAG: TRAP transporter substrate-binding protein [Clostridiales bacterium]|nr:TRAP transporter substrate-binding protein [Clostridiales bacterium]
MKKKVISIVLAGALVVSMGAMAGCGSSSSDDSADDTTSTAEAETDDTSAEAETDDTADADDESGVGEYDLSGLDQTYTLTLTQHDPENSATGTFLNNFAAAVEEASEGYLTIEVYHGATLAGPKDTYDYVLNGSADIGWGLQSFYADTFPVTEVFMLPLIDIQSATNGSQAIWEFWNTTDYMDEEYSNFHVLLLHTNCQSAIETVSTKIETLDDLAGMQLRGNAGPPTDFITNLGANPVSVSINDLYSNLDKGTLDGCITDWHAVNSFSLDEVLSYYLDENIGVSTYFMVMNQDSYDALPEVLQQLLDDVAEDSLKYTEVWDQYEEEVKEAVADELYYLSDEERAKLEDVAQQTIDEWIESMDAAGYDGQAIYDTAMECIANNQ